MNNGGWVVGLLLGLLLLSWEIAGVLAKGPKIDTLSQMYWWVRDWVRAHKGAAGVGVMAAALFGFLSWLFLHLTFEWL